MKKNLFLLFSIYFFVVQPLVIGVLWRQTDFFLLGAINLVAIILIGMVYNTVESEKKPETNEHEKKPESVNEPKVSFHDHFHAVTKERKKKSELVFPTIMSLIVVALIFFMYQYKTASIEVMLLLSIIIGFIVFALLTALFKHRIHKHFWRLIGTKIYVILLICSIAFTAYGYYQVYKDFNASIQDYIGQNLLGQERLPTSTYIFTGEWTVLWSGIWATTTEQTGNSDVFTLEKETGTVLWSSVWMEVTNTGTTVAISNIGNQKIMDAVIYLLKKYDVPLITKQDISFTYVSFKNPYYNEWRTAYANKMIGKTTNPSKYIVCESYIVMKGLLEKWKVPYTSTTVLNNFWAEAVRRDALNGCVKGKIVTDKTL